MFKRTLPLILVLALAGFTFQAFFTKDAAPEVRAAVPADTMTTLSERSVYQLGSTWTDQDGKTTPLADLRGRPQLVALVFTHCGYACPRIVHDLKTILRELPESQRDEVRVTLVSIDPERDTPEALRHFADMHDLGSPQWTLLRSDDDDVRELAAVLGVRYKQQADGQFAHSNVITLLDAEGVIIHQQQGLGGDPKASIDALSDLLVAATGR